MRTRGLMVSLLLWTLSWLCVYPVAAQSGGYQVAGDTYAANTGGTMTGISYQVQGTLGQPAVDTSLGESYAVTGGIWARDATRTDVLVLAKEARSNHAVIKRAEAGAPLTYILAVTNNGVRTQESVTVTDVLPVGLTLLPDSLQSQWGAYVAEGRTSGDAVQYRVTWTIPTLPANEIAVLTYQAYPITGTEGMTLTNIAVGMSASDGPVTATVSIRVYRPNRVYLPLVLRVYPPVPPVVEPVVHPLADAPAQCLTAAPVIIGDVYQDDFDTANDNDWYQFTATAGQTYQIATSALAARADTLLYLYAPGDCVNPIAQNDDISYPADIASQVIWTAPADGTYYAMIRNWDWQVYGADTGYRFIVAQATAVVQNTQPQSAPVLIKPAPPATPTAGGAQ